MKLLVFGINYLVAVYTLDCTCTSTILMSTKTVVMNLF